MTEPALRPGGRVCVTGASGYIASVLVAALKEIYDPEIPVNIYDLGLIYVVEVSEDKDVVVTMTLTTPHCPVAESMPARAAPQCMSPGANINETPPAMQEAQSFLRTAS